jgi:DNA-nicking Smr family endonuclease
VESASGGIAAIITEPLCRLPRALRDHARSRYACVMARHTKPGAEHDAADAAPARSDGDDGSLFRDAIGPVRRLPERAPPPAPSRPKPAARMAQRDDEQARSDFARLLSADTIEAGDTLSYRRDHVPPRVLRRLARGEYAAADELDLHGADARTAERLLRDFLREAAQAGAGCVRVVHGKGAGSGTGVPVLKNLVDRVLRQRSDVLAFHSAPPAQGGTGAVVVLLNANRR